MTAVADQPVRATVRDGGESRAAAARPGPAPRTTPLSLPTGTVLGSAVLRGWSLPVEPAVEPAGAAGAGRGWGWATGRPGRDWAVAGAPAHHVPGPAWPRRMVTSGRATLSWLAGWVALARLGILAPVPGPVGLPGPVRAKLREWRRRYLLAEVAGTLAALTAALTVHALTGSLASVALAGSVAETLGYYGVVLRRTLPALYARHAGAGPRRLLRTGRSLVAEVSDFLAAELADTLLVRPGLIYLAAGWVDSGVVGGLLIGKLLADIGFYAVVIPSYELRKRLMHR
jgi:hypothetical protein